MSELRVSDEQWRAVVVAAARAAAVADSRDVVDVLVERVVVSEREVRALSARVAAAELVVQDLAAFLIATSDCVEAVAAVNGVPFEVEHVARGE